MEEYLRRNFEVDAKRPSEEALMRWRSAVSVVKNPRRRFRMVADLAKRAEAERKRLKLQSSIFLMGVFFFFLMVSFLVNFVYKAGNRVGHYKLTKQVSDAGFSIEPDELASIIRAHDAKGVEQHGGVEGLARDICVSLNHGVISSEIPLRQNIYGFNRYAEKPPKGFWMFVWEALQDLTLIILMISAAASMGVGIATEGWPQGMYDGLGIILSVLLVVMITAISDYKQSLQFKDLDKEKNNIIVQVTRDGCRQKVSIYDLVVGDVVHLSIGDQVPADGIFISGYSLSIDESSLSGESEPVDVDKNKPFLLSGTKVQDGSGKMLVTSVGMRTEWGRLMVTLSEGGNDETPLQVKLNGVATIIGKIGLAFAVLTFLVLTARFLNTGSEVVKGKDGRNKIIGTPTETALTEFGLLMGGDFKTYSKEYKILKVEPFNSVRKKMSVLVAIPGDGGVRAFCKGASEIILNMCDKVLNSDGEAVPLSEEHRKSISDVINGFACEALRTLCTAFKDIEDSSNVDTIPEDGYILIAVVGIKDPVRPGVREAVETCLAAGITVRMVTGDNINTAKAIAKECGILTEGGLAIEGPDFRNKTPQEMEEIIPKLQVMARSLPLDKHTLVSQLRNVFKEVVAVTGDGTNDAPALHEADIGLAMGIAGTEVFNEINSRDMEKINVLSGLFSSWPFMMVMMSTVGFQIIIVEFLGTFAETVPLNKELWLVSVLIGAVSLVIAVILKCIPVAKTEQSKRHHDGYERLPSGPEVV
ncbi:hypothetical protein FEM48_Zijuj05G0028400 [Ziziphus jujuba var. spinosa]|uniref:P-type Cu(+) transporter n=1 Tax=Ziziphus jujuba var. spinosa TaxID=714518 RepID=A0A978VCE0_ZIZJJ|nr:hypothetical protein FEM48_Zijuj05G0028400 [Ziziphus jujuba var. spinosa]